MGDFISKFYIFGNSIPTRRKISVRLKCKCIYASLSWLVSRRKLSRKFQAVASGSITNNNCNTLIDCCRFFYSFSRAVCQYVYLVL